MFDFSDLPPLPFRIESQGDECIATLAGGERRDLRDLLGTMVRKASRPHVQYPRKSFASTLRERGLELGPDERSAIIDLAHEMYLASAGSEMGRNDWLGIAETARTLGLKVERVREMLMTEEGRRSLGWPWEVDGGWRIPGAAIRSESRARYMASLPVSDPYAGHD